MATSPIYLTEADVGRLVTVKDAIATLEALFATWGQPSTSNLPRQRARLAGGAFNLMGAAYGAKGVHGLKAYSGVKGAQFHTLLYSSRDGKLKAMIEADLFGQMRTGAASGLATKLLANRDAHTVGVIGAGKQSRTQIAAVCAVRPITRVKVFSRTAEHREAYARSVEKELGVEVRPASSAQACVAEADVVVTITNSAERNGWPEAHTSTWLAPIPTIVARSMRRRCCAPPLRPPITSSRPRWKQASFANWSQPASSPGRRSASSASLSPARPLGGHRDPT
jgi:ornithine cyclodeaminase/alanine dehydrogenase-like protein (mu-crystallin family)